MNDTKQGTLVTANGGTEQAVTPMADVEAGLISIPAKAYDVERAVRQVERDIALYKAIKVVALKLTEPRDWVVQKRNAEDPGSPFPMDRGLEPIRIAYGIDITDVHLTLEWTEDKAGRYYTYVATGKAHSRKLGGVLEDIGTCSQRDKFFGMVGGKLKEIEDVDMANIRKKAVTNLYSRLIRRTVGLLNVSLEDLTAAGFKLEVLPAITYGEGKQKARQQLSEAALKAVDEIQKIANELADGDEGLLKSAIQQASGFEATDNKTGAKYQKFVESARDLTSEGWIQATYGRIKGMLASVKPEVFARMFPNDKPPVQKPNIGAKK